MEGGFRTWAPEVGHSMGNEEDFNSGGGMVSRGVGERGLFWRDDFDVGEIDRKSVLGEAVSCITGAGEGNSTDEAFDFHAGAVLVGFPFLGAGVIGVDAGESDIPVMNGAE